MDEIYQSINETIRYGKPVILAAIIRANGSTPRHCGAKMVIQADLSIIGTIGGGKLEADVIQSALGIFASKQSKIFNYVLNGSDAALSDQICGGIGDILMQYIPSDDPIIQDIYQKACEISQKCEKGWFFTFFNQDSVQIAIIDAQENLIGNLPLCAEEIKALCTRPESILLHPLPDGQLFVEKIHHQKYAYIFGGGHVAKETATLAQHVNFHTVIVEDRAEFATAERFPKAACIIVPSYQQMPQFPITESDFILIITRGHLGDYDVLAAMLQTSAAYIGMIGSRTKRELIYKRLRENGFSEADIQRVHSPIGLSIKAETPAEIAVSIVAEMILKRAEQESLPEHLRQSPRPYPKL